MIHARGMILHRVAGTASVYMSFWSLVTDYFLVDEFCTITSHVCFMSNKRSKSFDKTVASPPHMDGSIIFTRLCQCAPYLTHASLGPPKSTPHTASRSIQLFLHSSRQRVLYCTKGRPYPLKTARSHGGSGPHLTHGYLGQTKSTTQTGSPSVQLFLQGSRS